MILKAFQCSIQLHSKNLSVEKWRKYTVFTFFVCKGFQQISFFPKALMATFSTILVTSQKSGFFIRKKVWRKVHSHFLKSIARNTNKTAQKTKNKHLYKYVLEFNFTSVSMSIRLLYLKNMERPRENRNKTKMFLN